MYTNTPVYTLIKIRNLIASAMPAVKDLRTCLRAYLMHVMTSLSHVRSASRMTIIIIPPYSETIAWVGDLTDGRYVQ